jgi:hypothetical protein
LWDAVSGVLASAWVKAWPWDATWETMWAAELASQRGAMRAVSKVSPTVDVKAVQWAVLVSCWVEL